MLETEVGDRVCGWLDCDESPCCGGIESFDTIRYNTTKDKRALNRATNAALGPRSTEYANRHIEVFIYLDNYCYLSTL